MCNHNTLCLFVESQRFGILACKRTTPLLRFDFLSSVFDRFKSFSLRFATLLAYAEKETQCVLQCCQVRVRVRANNFNENWKPNAEPINLSSILINTACYNELWCQLWLNYSHLLNIYIDRQRTLPASITYWLHDVIFINYTSAALQFPINLTIYSLMIIGVIMLMITDFSHYFSSP